MDNNTQVADMYEGELTEAEWLAELLTGTRLQLIGALRGEVTVDGEDVDAFCCLGVGCELDGRVDRVELSGYQLTALRRDVGGDDTRLNQNDTDDIDEHGSVKGYEGGYNAPLWSWMSLKDAAQCAANNDNFGMSFAQIAHWWQEGKNLGGKSGHAPVDGKGQPYPQMMQLT